MTHLVQIGNSQGIRIPKPLIKQAHLEGKELTLEVIEGGIFIAPIKKIREGWETSIKNTLAIHGSEDLDTEWLDAELNSDEELEW